MVLTNICTCLSSVKDITTACTLEPGDTVHVVFTCIHFRVTRCAFFRPGMDPIAPSAPVNLRGAIQPTSIKLSWDPPIRLTNFAYYIVAFITPPSNDTVNVTEPCANVGPLLPETMYTCSCTPFTFDGVAGDSAVISGTTTTPSEHHQIKST